jgi:hypothetical protein
LVKEAERFLQEDLAVQQSRLALAFIAQVGNRTPEVLSDPRIGKRVSALLKPKDSASELIANQLQLPKK